MYIENYDPYELTEELATNGLNYILGRFQDVWGIDRSSELTSDCLIGRRNLVAFEGHDIVGWIGVMADGELVHGCAGPGYSYSGRILESLLRRIIQESEKSKKQHYAFVPVDYLASAGCCIRAGMYLPEGDPVLQQKAYDKKVITLIKLVYPVPGDSNSNFNRLQSLKKVIKEKIQPSQVRLFLKSIVNLWRRTFDALKRYSFFTKAFLVFLFSFIYYCAGLLVVRHDISSYINFLTQKKAEQDRGELFQYLIVSEEALNTINNQIKENVTIVNSFINNAKGVYQKERQNSFSDIESILNKQQTTMELFALVISAYSKDLSKGNDSDEKNLELYQAILQYLSDESPYNGTKYPYKNFPDSINFNIDNRSLTEVLSVVTAVDRRHISFSFKPNADLEYGKITEYTVGKRECLKSEACVRQQLEKFVRGALAQ